MPHDTPSHLLPHPRYLDPRIDLAFKRVFGEHKDLLKSFLNALLPLPPNAPIVSLEYLASEQVPEIPGIAKNSVVDVKCVDTSGRIFIVEMQMLWSASFMQRMLFSGSQAYVKQLRKGRGYHELKPVYALAITSDVFAPHKPEYFHHFAIVNLQDSNERIEGLEFVFVELPKFKPTSADDQRLVKWLRFLTEVGEDEADFLNAWQADHEIHTALDCIEMSKLTPAQLDGYHASLDAARLETTLLSDAQALGEAIGEARGKAVGIAEAKAALLRSLRDSGMSPQAISVATQLALAEVLSALG